MQVSETQVYGKRTLTAINKKWTWLLAGDSHLGLMGPFADRSGSSLVSIKGGMIMHLGRWLEINTIWSWDLGAIFICVGGNDLMNEQVTHDEIA